MARPAILSTPPRPGRRRPLRPALPRVLLIIPPLVQPNAPLAATPLLTGFLRSQGVDARQADLSLDLVLRLFSRSGVAEIAAALRRTRGAGRGRTAVHTFLGRAADYQRTVDAAVRFLQGRDPALAARLAGRRFLPEGPRFAVLQDPALLDWAFGALGIQDRAKYLASLFLDDLADVVRAGLDPRFGLARYGETLALHAPRYAPLRHALDAAPSLIDRWIEELADGLLAAHRPALVGLTVPFPGCLYGALRVARAIRRRDPAVRIALGGGYVSTELRGLAEPALFDDVDYVVLDDGARPLLRLLEHLAGRRGEAELVRTFLRRDGRVRWCDAAGVPDVPWGKLGVPCLDGLPLARYLALVELPNPMHRLWSDTRWNRLMLAHGCYWHRCRFCDTSLDYIRRYDPAPVPVTLERMEALVRATGQSGFHFTDEALAPALLRRLADGLIARGLVCSWWGNIRFEDAFSPALVERLAAAGCVAVTGGLETAEDRLLALMDKGVSVVGAARVMRRFADAGVLVHAYLMYGFPSQTVQETVDSLECVRQLFAAGCLHSAYWHRFAATAHSPVGREPQRYGLRLRRVRTPARFACNEVAFTDATGTDHDGLGQALRKALYNYMHGLGLQEDVRAWFAAPVPRPRLGRRFIARALAAR